MSDLTIKCPTCSSEIELTEQLAGPLLADNQKRFAETLARQEAQAAQRLAEERENAKAAGKAEAAADKVAMAERLKEQDEKLRVAQAAQAAALKREQELKDKEAELELTVQKMIAAERPVLIAQCAKGRCTQNIEPATFAVRLAAV